MLKSKKIVILIVAAVIVLLIGGIAIYHQSSSRNPSTDTTENTSDGGTRDSTENSGKQTSAKTEYTEEEKALIESQTGVTVTDKGIVQVDIGAIQEEEESMAISRKKAEELVINELGEGAELISMDLRHEQENYYWATRASKGDETYQIWISAETGETFINQKE